MPAVIACLFFFSGALALVYEVLWQRRFALVFGSSAPATAAVLAAYFAGLALGSWGIRKQSARTLRTYALLECGVAMGALLAEALATFFDHRQSPETGRVFVKVIETFICLGLPTYCMGRTLPVLGAYIDQNRNRLGRTAGLLYVLNTFGAAAGVLIVPFYFLPTFGARNSLFLCAGGNLLIAIVAFILDRHALATPRSVENVSLSKSLAWLAFVSGAITFVAQVLWNRAFAQVHENSLHSFAIITATFILALACGGQIARVVLNRAIEPRKILFACWIAAGLFLVVSPWLFLSSTNGLAFIPSHARGRLVQLALMVVFPGATLMGIALPAIMQMSRAAVLGRLLSVNLLGAVIGALVAGFVMPQLVGLWVGLMISGALLAAAAFALFARAIPILIVLCSLAFVKLDLPRVRVLPDRGEKLISIQEGADGIAAVIERGNSRRLKLNNAYVLGGTASTGDERMQSHIPLLLHPKPDKVAYMGLGTGISAGGALFHPVKEITILELCPEVAEAARAHFAEANMHILEQPNTRLVLEDARNFFRHTDEKFDVIIGDLVVPWRAGEAALFTRETMEAAKRALKPGGIYCQWLPMFQISENDFKILRNTFFTVFGDVYIWRGDFSPEQTAIALIALQGGALSNEATDKRIREMRPDPTNLHLVSDYALWMNFAGIMGRLDNFGTDSIPPAQINSENHPWVELSSRSDLAVIERTLGGYHFQDWLCRLQLETTDSPLRKRATLPDHLWNATEAGLRLGEYTVAVSENNPAEAQKLQVKLKQMVPPDLYKLLFPEDAN